MAKKPNTGISRPASIKDHVRQLIDWMAQGVYEKDQIIAIALLCAVAGENMFLLGPPGTAKSMVASRLKKVFKEGKSFDYLMSRFSTPDEIYGPVSISRLKNEDRYERLTAGYLPDAEVVFLDEIWKAGPSIQNTLLTIINEHIFHNGGRIIPTPMKILIAASNELPAKDEGLEALWDRFLIRMVSNCIVNDKAFFKMLKSNNVEPEPLSETLYITEEIYQLWQNESKNIDIHSSVVKAIKAVRKNFAALEKEDGNQLRYYVSDRRWRKAYRLMQTSAYLNGRKEINLTDYLLLTHCLWNDVECIPNVLKAIAASISCNTLRTFNEIDKSLRQIMVPKNQQASGGTIKQNSDIFAECDYFYYLIENYPDGEAYFSKWDYLALNNQPRQGVMYLDTKRNKMIIHTLFPGRPFDAKTQNATNLKKVTIQKFPQGAIIDGTPYSFRRKANTSKTTLGESFQNLPIYHRVGLLQELFKTSVSEWNKLVADNWINCDNIFLSPNELALVDRMIGEVEELIKTTEVKLNNVVMMIK